MILADMGAAEVKRRVKRSRRGQDGGKKRSARSSMLSEHIFDPEQRWRSGHVVRLKSHLGAAEGVFGVGAAPVPADRVFDEGLEFALQDVKLAEKLVSISIMANMTLPSGKLREPASSQPAPTARPRASSARRTQSRFTRSSGDPKLRVKPVPVNHVATTRRVFRAASWPHRPSRDLRRG